MEIDLELIVSIAHHTFENMNSEQKEDFVKRALFDQLVKKIFNTELLNYTEKNMNKFGSHYSCKIKLSK